MGINICFTEGKEVCEVPSMINMETNLPFGSDKSSFPMLDSTLARPKEEIGKIFQKGKIFGVIENTGALKMILLYTLLGT